MDMRTCFGQDPVARVYIDGEYEGYTGSNCLLAEGVHTIGVGGFIDRGFITFTFQYFDAGTGGNPMTIDVNSDLTIAVYYHTEWIG